MSLLDENKCSDGKRHYWQWHDRSFELDSSIGDIQECRRCGQARIINERGDAKRHGESVDALIADYWEGRKNGRGSKGSSGSRGKGRGRSR